MTTDQNTTACPEPSDLAAYVDGKVTADERATIQRHLADCDDCREVVADAVRLRDEMRVLLFWKRTDVRVGGGVLALAASLILVVQVRPELNPFRSPTPYEELVAAVGTNRTVEGRLSGGFRYGPLRSPTRSGGAPATSYEVLAAAARISTQAERAPDAERLHALGVARLVTGDLDGAVQALQDAIDLEPTRATFQSDLAAAFLARGSNEHSRDFPMALAAAERALRLDATLSEAYFNRALALERMGLNDAAAKAWADYLEHDNATGWSDEAKRRAANRRLGSGTMPSGPTPRAIRTVVETDLFIRLSTLRRGTKVFDEAYGEASHLSSVLQQSTGDRDLVDALRALPTASPAHLQGYQAYAEGRRAYDRDDLGTAMAAFRQARRSLADSSSPVRLWATLYDAVGLYYSTNYVASLDTLEKLLPHVARRGYETLTGRVEWMIGLNSLNLARFEEALTHYQNAAQIFVRIRDYEEEVSVRRGLWEVHRKLGLYAEAWRHALPALATLPRLAEPRRRHSLLMTLGQGSLDQGLPEVARLLFDMGVTAADAWAQPVARVEARLNRARASLALGDRIGARRDTAEARAVLESIPESDLVRRLEIELLLSEAAVAVPNDGIEILTKTLEKYTSGGRALRRPRLHLQRAQLFSALGNVASAKLDLDAGIQELERQRRSVRVEGLGDTRVADEWPLFEAVVTLLVEHGQFEEALEYLERARSVDASAANSTLEINDLRRRTTQAPVVSFMLRDDRVYVWRLDGQIHFREIALRRGMLDRAIVRFTSALRDGKRDDETGRFLYIRLLAPEVAALSPGTVVTIVPDGSLHALPFGALPDQAGRLAIERYAFNYAPSASTALANSKRLVAQPVLTSTTRVLIVGEPSTRLRRLPRAADEAKQLARLFARNTFITGHDATPNRVRSELPVHDAFHFAGHAISGTQDMRQSYLALAADSENAPARLEAVDLEQLPLEHVRLGVLSACSTALGDDLRGLGRASLARALLRSGVASVVATLWDVEDEAIAAVWPAFYAAILGGRSTPEAVRDAQLAGLRSAPNSYGWAAVVSLGAVAQGSTGSLTCKQQQGALTC